ncbi:MAG: T9SS type A sorting domain-containing protein, partial [Candidatus Zixiibacteriota bacterium]
DVMTMAFIISGSPFPDFPRHPDSDTIKVESANAAPGETIELPIYIKTIDTLTAFQISIETDPAYITVDTLVVLDSFFFGFSYCSGHTYGYCFDEGIFIGDPITLLPGEYHIADLTVTVNPEIEDPDTTLISFSNDPELLHYTAFSNGPFFTPVTVDGEIQIIPTGIENGERDNIPGKLSISAYPNPFNAITTIRVALPEPGQVELTIYDLIGRQIGTLLDEYRQAGIHTITFDASDLSSGVYFYRLQAGDKEETKKMVLLK